MKISEILKNNDGANISITVSLADLTQFAKDLIEDGKRQAEAMPKEDKVLSAKEAAEALGVGLPCLWRWERSGYFRPNARIGRKVTYLQSQIDALRGIRK